MDIIDENKYKEFKYILSGCRTILDAYFFAEIYMKKNPEMKNLIHSTINGKRYESVLDFKTIKSTIETSNEYQYRDDVEEIIDINSKKTYDITQKRSLTRISKHKPPKPSVTKINKVSDFETKRKNTKNCPHCNHSCTTNIDISYIICGYTDSRAGYDWKGCGKDWCFKCEKILCKSWETHQLFVDTNRIHNIDCCKTHAKDYQRQYPVDYCQCDNKNVSRQFEFKSFC